MGSYASFAELSADRRRDVTTAHKLIGTGLRDFLAELYPDNAHFIYELLQNAEDAGASNVSFDLGKSRLLFTHDGSRLFTLDDIEQITTIGNSAKAGDDTKIGKFGVGFKAVFSYTNRPQVRSGEFAFAIEDLFVPEVIDARPSDGKTTFVFPFDRKEKPREDAYAEVAQVLEGLGASTVMFLRNIRTITFVLGDGRQGKVARIDGEYPFIRIQRQFAGKAEESHWIRLVGDHSLAKVIPQGQSVAAAFRLDGDPAKRKPDKGKAAAVNVQPLERGDTCVYFPADKEVSGLHFHIHAPFAPTPARDSVKDTPGNAQLRLAIARLIVDSLPKLRDDGWLGDGLLAALPSDGDAIPADYRPIAERIKQAFWDTELTPVLGGGFAPAKTLVSSPSEFRSAINATDLKFLTSIADGDYPAKPRWIAPRDGRVRLFLQGLGVPEFGWTELSGAMWNAANDTPLGTERLWVRWLTAKEPERLRAFYEFLGQGVVREELSQYDLEDVPLFGRGTHSRLFLVKGSEVFLPSSRKDTAPNRIAQELAYFDEDKASESKRRLEALYDAAGVKRWNERTAVEQRIEAYRSKLFPADDLHFEDMRLFVRYANEHPAELDLFRSVWIFKCHGPGAQLYWAYASKVYIDAPFQRTGLAALYGSEDRHLLWRDYEGNVEGVADFAISIGATDGIAIEKANVYRNPQVKRAWWAHGQRESAYKRFVDWDLPGFDAIVDSGNPDLLAMLWRMAAESDGSYADASFRINASSPTYALDSQLAQRLSSEAWVLDREGELRTPESMTVEELPVGWPEPGPDSLAIRLGFGEEARARDDAEIERRRQAHELGVPLDLLNELQGLTDEEKRAAVDAIRQVKQRLVFPSASSSDPERRASVVGQDAKEAPEFETELRQRSIVKGTAEVRERVKQYLREHYTNDAGELFCQACHQKAEFQLDGRWYFEAVQFLPKRVQAHHQNALALCPRCAALYTYVRDTSDDVLVQSLGDVQVGAEVGQVSVPVVLNGRYTELWFTGKHAIDLQTVLRVGGAQRAKKGTK